MIARLYRIIVRKLLLLYFLGLIHSSSLDIIFHIKQMTGLKRSPIIRKVRPLVKILTNVKLMKNLGHGGFKTR